MDANEEACVRVLVAGANGNTGTRVVRLLGDGPHEPLAMIRDEAQEAKFADLGVETVLADLEEPVGHAVEGCDAVIFAAGSGAGTGLDKTRAVDRDGAIRLVDAAGEAGADRFVMLSSMGADPTAEGGGMNAYYRCKGVADVHLHDSGLVHTVVRPGRLTDDEGTGRIEAAVSLGRRGRIPRDDVARVLVECLDREATRGRTFEILSGDTPIEEALESL